MSNIVHVPKAYWDCAANNLAQVFGRQRLSIYDRARGFRA